MKIKSSKQNPLKIIALVAIIICVLLAGWLYYAHHFQKWPFLPPANTNSSSNVNYKPPTTDQTTAGNNVKEQVANQAKDDSKTTGPPQQASNAAIDITASNKTSSTLMVRTLIQSVTSTGTCTLTMSGPNGGSYSATAGIQAMASTSTCKGFDVPLAGLAHGSWQIKIDFVDGTNTGSTSREVTL